jgi:hypothetical protein
MQSRGKSGIRSGLHQRRWICFVRIILHCCSLVVVIYRCLNDSRHLLKRLVNGDRAHRAGHVLYVEHRGLRGRGKRGYWQAEQQEVYALLIPFNGRKSAKSKDRRRGRALLAPISKTKSAAYAGCDRQHSCPPGRSSRGRDAAFGKQRREIQVSAQ